MSKKSGPKILFIDLETLPMEVYSFGMFDQNFSLEMVKQHTTMASWAASWDGSNKVFYSDVSKNKNIRDDSKICKKLQKLINSADIVVGHAVCRFDQKKSNYRFIVNNLKPTTQDRTIDTLKIAKKHFSFDSNKLEHLAEILKVDTKKYTNRKFNGFKLWRACLEKNKSAWAEMKKYNIIDVIVLKQVYKKLIPWDKSINFNVYHEHNENKCSCGSFVLKKNGFRYRNLGRYQRYICGDCGKPHLGKTNLLSKIKRRDMLK